MSRRLPLQSPLPTVDATRKRLGGRATSNPSAGELVDVVTDLGLHKEGVILFARADEIDVWIANGAVLRTTRARAASLHAVTSRELVAVANDARVFGTLLEGQRVRYQHDAGALAEGTLVEKCRFGALLLHDDGTVVGVGFRRIWPAGKPGDN